jgi:hypothetical protein
MRFMEKEFLPNGGGRKLSAHIQDSYKDHLQQARRERIAHEDGPRVSLDSLRNRVVLQEMKLVYNQLTGVGEQLLDLKLSSLLPRTQGVGTLGRPELHALNYDLAKLAASIFGPETARFAYERINGVISRAFN